MPRYYFDTEYGGSAYRDSEGVELPSLDVAREELEKLLRDVAYGRPTDGGHDLLVATVRCDGEVVLCDRVVTADAISALSSSRPSVC